MSIQWWILLALYVCMYIKGEFYRNVSCTWNYIICRYGWPEIIFMSDQQRYVILIFWASMFVLTRGQTGTVHFHSCPSTVVLRRRDVSSRNNPAKKRLTTWSPKTKTTCLCRSGYKILSAVGCEQRMEEPVHVLKPGKHPEVSTKSPKVLKG